MRLFEWEAKKVLSEYGIAAPRGCLASTAALAAEKARSLATSSAVKAQVLRGGRMKAHLVRLVGGPEDVEAAGADIIARLGGDAADPPLLIEEIVPVIKEYFVACLYEGGSGAPRLVLSDRGGIHVEDAAESAHVLPFDPRLGIRAFEARRAVRKLGLAGRELIGLARAVETLARCFLEIDATLLEVNPLGQKEDGSFVALDVHLEIDDDAHFRQKAIMDRFQLQARGWGERKPSSFELAASKIDALDHRGVAGRVVEFDGDIALLIGGGGASLTVFDAVRKLGGKPANYCEVGGNPTVKKVAAITKLLLEKPGVKRLAVIMNVVNNTRADLMARGVIMGCLACGRKPSETIAVFRIPGAWEGESRQLLTHYGVRALGRSVSIDEAATMAVAGGG